MLLILQTFQNLFIWRLRLNEQQVRRDNKQVQKALIISLWFCLFSWWNCMILQYFPCKECLVFPIHKHPALSSGFWSYDSFPGNFNQIKLFPVCCFSFTHIGHVQICFNGLWVLYRSENFIEMYGYYVLILWKTRYDILKKKLDIFAL